MNLILFSHFDRSNDEYHGQHSIATSLGFETTNRLVWIIFMTSILAGSVNIFVFKEYRTAGLMIGIMAGFLALIQVRGGFFSYHDRYRYVGDAIFFLPLLYILFE